MLDLEIRPTLVVGLDLILQNSISLLHRLTL